LSQLGKGSFTQGRRAMLCRSHGVPPEVRT
jgi:hypothetical protein